MLHNYTEMLKFGSETTTELWPKRSLLLGKSSRFGQRSNLRNNLNFGICKLLPTSCQIKQSVGTLTTTPGANQLCSYFWS